MARNQILQEGLSSAERSRDTSRPPKSNRNESVNDPLGGNQGLVGIEPFGGSLFKKLLWQSTPHRPRLLQGQSPFVAPMITDSRDRQVFGQSTGLDPR